MTRQNLIDTISNKESFLCVGLDVDLARVPQELLDFDDPIFEFNRRVIDATADHCVAYKPNLAFYESQGDRGWPALKKTLDYIPKTHFTIADAKRGDIGNTARMYAQTFFKELSFDAVTVAPYMGRDSVDPFLDFEGKWVILLALTSNAGSQDFQFIPDSGGTMLYQHVVAKAKEWGTNEQLMFVVGATQSSHLQDLRSRADDYFFLVPGVGAQGGSLTEVYKSAAVANDVGLLVNSSRGIIYAGQDKTHPFDHVAHASSQVHKEMKSLMQE